LAKHIKLVTQKLNKETEDRRTRQDAKQHKLPEADSKYNIWLNIFPHVAQIFTTRTAFGNNIKEEALKSLRKTTQSVNCPSESAHVFC
jgi:hypothetical protein